MSQLRTLLRRCPNVVSLRLRSVDEEEEDEEDEEEDEEDEDEDEDEDEEDEDDEEDAMVIFVATELGRHSTRALHSLPFQLNLSAFVPEKLKTPTKQHQREERVTKTKA